jgi:hypothetical protein
MPLWNAHRPDLSTHTAARFAVGAAFSLACAALAGCSSSSSGPSDAGDAGGSDDATTCYPDNDGITGGDYIYKLNVDDTGFSKNLISTQNDSQITLTLTNTGTRPHGFTVGCTTTVAPAGCSPHVCFPDTATIEPIAPGVTKTITFDTPTPDGIIYPFRSSEPADEGVPGLNKGQWSLM